MNRAMIRQLAAVHGTPLYLYDPECIQASLADVRAAFPGFRVIYSVKANPFEPVLSLLGSLGAGIDAASKNEVLSCARLGFPASEIFYSAPGKSERDITACIGTSQIIADSFHELTVIDAVAQQRGIVAEVGVRLNIPRVEMRDSRFEVMSGEESKFGIALDTFLQDIPTLRTLAHVRINGLHVYFGSQITDARLAAENFMAISRAALALRAHFPLAYVNYGGGFGVPYEPDEPSLDLQETARIIYADAGTRAMLESGVRCNIELGRYLTARGGLYVTTVADVKRAGAVTFVILDGGMNTFFRPKFTGQTHRVTALGSADGTAEDTKKTETVRLVGNTCTPLDVMYEAVTLPTVEPGDLLVFENAGAYGYSMSMLDFISFDRPAQVMAAWAE